MSHARLERAPEPGVDVALSHPAATHVVELEGRSIGYALRRAQRGSIGMVVTPEGLRVSAPRWVAVRDIEKALFEKSRWIVSKLIEQRERAARSLEARVVWRTGAVLPFLGEPLELVMGSSVKRATLVSEQPGGVSRLHLPMRDGDPPERIAKAVRQWLRTEALQLFESRCIYYMAQVGVRFSRLSLSSARTRWGSASSSGAIRLHWRLAHFPLHVIDYVVVHELAHLREMNHSPRFWSIVASILPEYEASRAQLRHQILPDFG